MNILNWNLVSCLVSIGFQEVLILKNKKVGKVIIVAFIPSNVGSFVIAEILKYLRYSQNVQTQNQKKLKCSLFYYPSMWQKPQLHSLSPKFSHLL